MRSLIMLITGAFIAWNYPQPEIAKNIQSWAMKAVWSIVQNGRMPPQKEKTSNEIIEPDDYFDRPVWTVNTKNRQKLSDGLIKSALSINESPKKKSRANYSYAELNFVQPNSVFSSVRHAPLFAQISFIMALCFATFYFIPVGFDCLFPLNSQRVRHRDFERWRRTRWRGAWLSLIGWSSFGLLIGIILSA